MKAHYDDSQRIAENQRSRNWCLLLYPDDEAHALAYASLGKGYQFVSILHDQCENDEGGIKKPHYHVVLRFKQARWKTAIAAELGIASNYIQICRGLTGAYCYLVHDGLPGYHQYPHDLLVGPLYNEAVKALEHERTQDQKMLTILHIIDESGFLNERKLLEKCCEAGLCGDFLRLGSLIPRLIELHNTDISDPLPFDS